MDLKLLIVLFLKVSISLIVFGLGLNATLADALSVLRRPRELGRAFLSMNVLMPALALAMALNFNFHPAVKIVLVALSVAPVPPMLPRTALREGGRKDYTIGLLVAMAVLSIVVIPVTMEIFQPLAGVRLREPVSSVSWLVLKSILLPLSAGIALRSLAPGLTKRLVEPSLRFPYLFLRVSRLDTGWAVLTPRTAVCCHWRHLRGIPVWPWRSPMQTSLTKSWPCQPWLFT